MDGEVMEGEVMKREVMASVIGTRKKTKTKESEAHHFTLETLEFANIYLEFADFF